MIHAGEEFVFVKGTAAVCARATFAQVPSDLETEVVAMGVEVASCLSQVKQRPGRKKAE